MKTKIATERNALAELAEFLGKEAEHPSDSFKQKIIEKMGVDGYERYIAKKRKFAKAQRIVAELAKVEEPIDLRTVGMTHLADILEADTNRAVEIVRNCRAIVAKRPKYLMLENVAALVSKKFLPLFNKWQDELAGYGYKNFAKRMNAKHYGTPQNRDRIFLFSIRDDGKVVVQVMCKGDGLPQKNGKVNNDPPRIHHQFFREEHLKVRPITDEEKARAVAMRGRGMGVEPSTVIVSLDYQHGFVASLSGDCDGGLGTVERSAE